jgi:hypothetical protein
VRKGTRTTCQATRLPQGTAQLRVCVWLLLAKRRRGRGLLLLLLLLLLLRLLLLLLLLDICISIPSSFHSAGCRAHVGTPERWTKHASRTTAKDGLARRPV